MTQNALQGRINGSMPPEHANGLPPEPEKSALSSDSAPGGDPLAVPSMFTDDTSLTSLPCFEQLQSWRSCHPTFRHRNAIRSSSLRSSTELSLPLPPPYAYTASSQIDTWTQTGWTRGHIRHLFDVLTTWDDIPFSLLRKDDFLTDFEAGSSRFCSTALVNALLALSTRLINGKEDDSDILPSGWFGSRRFLLKANALLRNQGFPDGLPDIQSLGILALYHVRCGRENEARDLANLCASSVRALCLREVAVDSANEHYFKVRATTYCGAVSLLRMLYLTTGTVFNEAVGARQEDQFILDDLPCGTTANVTGENREHYGNYIRVHRFNNT
ncbi:Conidial development protein fluffy [Beauveria bassiana]|nr:Conidial development protein fluffy [Beauveria bassiana]